MTEFENGNRVRYKGTLIPRLTGQEGMFIGIGRNGWAVVDFDVDGEMKVAPDNLELVVAPAVPEPMAFINQSTTNAYKAGRNFHMRTNKRIQMLFDGLAAAGVQHRCNWQARRDGKAIGNGKMPDVEHLAFVGDGFAPSISTAVLINYSDEGYGLYVEVDSNKIEDDVKRIATPRKEAKGKPILAKVSIEAAWDVAEYLDRTISTACPSPNVKAWEEVRDALYALTNDTDAIVTDSDDI